MTADDAVPQAGTGALAGTRVVELAQNAAIPYCGRLLAGMGADVVKVEPPGGDAMRRLAQLGPLESKAYATINPGKRALALDLDAPGSADVLDGLFRWADIALVAFKQSDLERFGIDYRSAQESNPSIVYVVHTAFGPDGPDAEQGGYDVLVQAFSGMGFIMNRSSGGVPLPTRPAVNDFGTGMVSALAAVAALRHRDLTGEGQRVDTSLLGTAFGLSTPIVGFFDAVDREPIAEFEEDLRHLRSAGVDFDGQRELYETRVLAGQGAFQLYFRHYGTSDGLIAIAGLSAGLIAKFHEVTGVARPSDPSAVEDPGFQTVVAAAEAVFRSRSTADWLEVLREAGVPSSRYNTPVESIREEQAEVNGFVTDLEHPVFGSYRTVGMPFLMERTPTRIAGPSPTFGQHTDEVLAEIGLGSVIGDLRRRGVVT
ncbi:MAG: CoA transferase [Acidimicrobiia bacterium]|nr:CoA transferase [Acidimicrobiia bacterium]